MLEVGWGRFRAGRSQRTSPFDTEDLAQGGGEGVMFARLTAFAATYTSVSREPSSGKREEPVHPAPLYEI
jgi:hypothetical protein